MQYAGKTAQQLNLRSGIYEDCFKGNVSSPSCRRLFHHFSKVFVKVLDIEFSSLKGVEGGEEQEEGLQIMAMLFCVGNRKQFGC